MVKNLTNGWKLSKVCTIKGHSHTESSHSLRQIDASGWVGLALWR